MKVNLFLYIFVYVLIICNKVFIKWKLFVLFFILYVVKIWNLSLFEKFEFLLFFGLFKIFFDNLFWLVINNINDVYLVLCNIDIFFSFFKMKGIGVIKKEGL